jgi:hypothetical protein
LHADLVALGYTGSYNRVAAFARNGRPIGSASSRPRRARHLRAAGFQPGEAFQFDWSEDWAVIGGERTKLQVAHIKLSHSRAFMLRAYLLQTHEMLFDAHWHAFRVFGGVPQRGIYDNMKTAVDRSAAARRGRSTPASWRWPATMCSSPSSAIRRRAGRRAGREERPGRPPPALAADAGLPDLAALNAWLEQRCIELWQRDAAWHAARHDRRVWAEERPHADADAAGRSTASSSRASASRRPA